jgi:16S rRNA (cytidine1402-2'-O)-methyltransferase
VSKLYLVPSPISEDIRCIPQGTVDIIRSSRIFICERIRSSRRYIKKIIPEFDIDDTVFIELKKGGDIRRDSEIEGVIKSRKDISFLSEAGIPCIADPGSDLVNLARKNDYEIVPLTGPSSIFLALMASGMSGQHFTFRGYLPVKKPDLNKEINFLNREVMRSGYTQIFIETPYRNLTLFESLIAQLSPSLQLSIALGIYTEFQYLQTKAVLDWSKDKEIKEVLNTKIPSIFIVGK